MADRAVDPPTFTVEEDHAERGGGGFGRAATDMWMYSAAGPRLFKEGEEIPAGYEDSPAKVREWGVGQ